MANPQTENGFVKFANEIWNEVLRRDFTKRQKDIILFIWRLSYGCRRKSAYIPLLKDFELCGVGQQNITKELNYLVTAKVIIWDKTACEFTVTKDYDLWQISPVRGWDDERFKALIHQNIDKKTSQNEKPKKEKLKVKILYTSQNKKWSLLKLRSKYFSKQEVEQGSNPWRCRVKRVSKDIITDIITDNTTSTTTTTGASEELEFGKLFEIYCKNFLENGEKFTEFDSQEVGALYDDYGGEWLLLAMREAFRHKIKTLAYIHGILKGYKERGGPEVESTLDDTKRDPPPRGKHRNRQQQQIDDLEKFIQEEKTREQSRVS